MLKKSPAPSLIILALLIAGATVTSCNNGNTNTGSPAAATSSPAPTPKTGFEADLEYVRKGQYTYIWVFSRKDGKPLDKNDAAYLRTNAPQVVDWVTTDQGTRVIAGTNFDLAQGNPSLKIDPPLALLQKRFNAEDYTSK